MRARVCCVVQRVVGLEWVCDWVWRTMSPILWCELHVCCLLRVCCPLCSHASCLLGVCACRELGAC